jgi:hypothetical protein
MKKITIPQVRFKKDIGEIRNANNKLPQTNY